MPRRVADPAVMRAVAHPLRLAILTEMWDADRPLRATDLAEILGEPANSVSYHIRRLRDAGYVLDSEGEAVWLAGLSRRGLSRSGTERRSSAELDRIWNWAIARGYTWETDTYVSPERLRAE